jgi:hypothetical protein
MKRLIIIAIFLMLTGCATPFHHTVILPPITIHISDDCSGRRGWAASDRAEICVEGYEEDGLFVPTQKVLGHEITHIMRHIDKKIKNPDGN